MKSTKRGSATDHGSRAMGEGLARRIVGGMIRSLREAQNLTQRQVAESTCGRPWELSRSAISSIERGRSLPSLEALVALSRVLHVDPMEVLEHVERAAGPVPDLARLSRKEQVEKADELFWSGRYREASAIYEILLAGLPSASDPDATVAVRWRATYEIRRAASLRRIGSLLAARSAAERIVALTVEHPDLQAEGYMVLSSAYRHMNNLPLALDAVNRAMDVAPADDTKLRGRLCIQKGSCLFQAEQFTAARSEFLEARKLARRAGDHQHTSHVEGNIGLCWVRLGRVDRARLWIEQAIETAQRQSIPNLEAHWLVELGRIALDAGNPEFAERRANAAIRLARPLDHWLNVFRAEWLLYLSGQKRRPGRSDRRRLSYMRRLLLRLERFEGDPTVQEFKEIALRAGDKFERKPS